MSGKRIILKFIFLIFIPLYIHSTQFTDFFLNILDSLEIYVEKNDSLKSLKFFYVLKDFDSTRYEPYYLMGKYYYNKSDYKKAKEFFNKTVSLYQNEDITYLYIKMLLLTDDTTFLKTLNNALIKYPASLKILKLKLLFFDKNNMIDSFPSITDKIIVIDANDYEAYFAMAKYYLSKKNYNLAQNYFEKLQKKNSIDKEYFLIGGEIYNGLNDYDKSIKYFDKLFNTEYDYISYIRNLDNYFFKSNDDSFKILISKALDRYPDSTEFYKKFFSYIVTKKEYQLLSSLDEKIEKNNLFQVDLFENMGKEFFKIDSYEFSKKYFKTIFQKDKNYFSKEALQTFIITEDYDLSEKIISNMNLKTFLDSTFFYKFKGIIKYNNSQLDSAETYFEKLFIINDTDTTNIKLLALIFSKNKKYTKLNDLIESIKEKFPELSERLKGKYIQ